MIDHITKFTNKAGRVHYHVFYASKRQRNLEEGKLTMTMIDFILNGRCDTRYTETGKVEYFWHC